MCKSLPTPFSRPTTGPALPHGRGMTFTTQPLSATYTVHVYQHNQKTDKKKNTDRFQRHMNDTSSKRSVTPVPAPYRQRRYRDDHSAMAPIHHLSYFLLLIPRTCTAQSTTSTPRRCRRRRKSIVLHTKPPSRSPTYPPLTDCATLSWHIPLIFPHPASSSATTTPLPPNQHSTTHCRRAPACFTSRAQPSAQHQQHQNAPGRPFPEQSVVSQGAHEAAIDVTGIIGHR